MSKGEYAMWCSNCGIDYGEGAVCPDCGCAGTAVPEPVWGKSKLPGEVMKAWPLDEEGEPVRPVFLTHCSCTDMEDVLTAGLLEAYNIPVIQSNPNNGRLGKLIIGISGTGADIFVPETMKEEALSLIKGEVK